MVLLTVPHWSQCSSENLIFPRDPSPPHSAAPVRSERIWINLLTSLRGRQSHTVQGNSQQKEQETPTVLHKCIFGQAV